MIWLILAGFLALLLTATSILLLRLPRPVKAQIIRQFWSPIVIAASGDPPPPASGPAWQPEWEPAATVSTLREIVSAGLREGTLASASLDNAPIHVSRFRFAYQDLRDPQLDALAGELQLDRAVAGLNGDLAVLRRVKSVVRSVAEHTEESLSRQLSYGAPEDAFSILKAVREGHTLQCHAYTLLLVQSLAALGYTARQSSCGYFLPREHVVVEAWSPEYLKWILLDPDYDLSYVRNGVPLSAYEAQQTVATFERAFREWNFENSTIVSEQLRERQAALGVFLSTRPELLEGVQVVRGESSSPRIQDKLAESGTGMILELHRSFAIGLRNDQLSKRYPFGHPQRSAQAAMAAGAARWLRAYDGLLTDDLTDLYWSLHAVRLGFQSAQPGAVRVVMGTFTPGFKCFRVAMNDRVMDTRDGSVVWELSPGTNSIRVSAVNLRGREGKASTATIQLS